MARYAGGGGVKGVRGIVGTEKLLLFQALAGFINHRGIIITMDELMKYLMIIESFSF